MSVARLDDHRPEPRRGLIVSGHQPDLLPYSGFWWKLANSDLMDLRITAQIVRTPGYQRRVQMREKWVNVVLAEGQSLRVPIDTVEIDNAATRHGLINAIRGRYAGSPFYKQRVGDLCDAIDAQHSDLLWQFNLGLLVWMRDYLGITTPFSIGGESAATGTQGVLEWLSRYPHADTYLAGNGARKYMSDVTPFDEAGIAVEWSRHRPVTGDSIVSVLMDHENPMDIIREEQA